MTIRLDQSLKTTAESLGLYVVISVPHPDAEFSPAAENQTSPSSRQEEAVDEKRRMLLR
jgi:hypothetical protein